MDRSQLGMGPPGTVLSPEVTIVNIEHIEPLCSQVSPLSGLIPGDYCVLKKYVQ